MSISAISSNAMQYQQMMPKAPPSGANMYENLCNDLGLDSTDESNEITKDMLSSLIDEIESGSSTQDKGKLGFLKQLMQNFDEVAGDDGTISATDITNNVDALKPPQGGEPPSSGMFSVTMNNMYNWLNPSDITAEQLIPPIDLKV